MTRFSRTFLYASIPALALAAAVSQSHAGGFALKERSARAQGLSFAGASAGSGGLSSMGFNPAAIGLVQPGFNNAELSGGISLIQPIADGKTSIGGVPTGETVDADRFAGVSNGYAGYRLEDDILIGLSLYTPFGLTTAYDQPFSGAGDGLTSSLQTIQFSPVVAWEPMESLTLAVTGHIMYTDARLTSAGVNLDGDSTNIGFGAGVLWRPVAGTQLGLAYQHGYDLALTGTAQGPGTGGFAVPLTASAQLPSTISLGIVQNVTDDIRLMGEVQWQNWSVFDKIDVTINNAVFQSDPQNYDDAFFFAAGGEYDVTDALTVRMGAAYDQTPTVDSNFLQGGTRLGRTVRLPDTDRIWLSIGASYDMNDHMSIDVGYSYLFGLEDSVVDLRTAPGTSITYEGGAHILSVGGSIRF